MADQTIDIPGVGSVSFPDSMTEAQVNAAATRLYQNANVGKKQPPVTSWTDKAVSLLPAAGATAGGIIGGIGGTVAGFGVGGVPGAAGGAGLGGAAGEAAKQLINRARGAEAPQSASDAALAIGKEGALDAAATGAMGAIGSKVMPAATMGLMDYGTNPNVPKVGAAIGRTVGAVAPTVGGAIEAGPMGAIAGLIAASKGAWAGGKTGWFTAKLTQDAARPIASILSQATGAPIAAIAETLSGLTLNHAIQALIGAGVPTGEAVKTVANASVKSVAMQPDYGYGPRWDEASGSYSGPPKGLGFLGPLKTSSGDTMSEYSIDGEINGKQVQYPAIVPTLTRSEVAQLLTAKSGEKIPQSIQDKAAAYAKNRIDSGKDTFAQTGEQQNLYPDIARNKIIQGYK